MRLFYTAFLIFFLHHTTGYAQYTLKGIVQDSSGQSTLAGASIQLGSSYRGVISHNDGRFEIEGLESGTYTLKISYIGYTTQIQSVQVPRAEPLIIQLQVHTLIADEVVVQSTRVSKQSPFSFQDIPREKIEALNVGQDIPRLLEYTPSAVYTSDAGHGIGYTGIRIRGSDATRTNVTINGIPLNDSESQGVFWVNLPDFASSVDNIQIQRGVGTSSNGAGAFGASVNVQTNQLREKAYLETNHSYGSFNSFKHNVLLGTGLIQDKFTVDARASLIRSDGFIDRARADLRSLYLSGGYYGKKSYARFNFITGREVTYQAWYGVPESRLRGDQEGMLAYISRNFLNEEDAANLLNSDSRTYNSRLYEEEVDDYQQDHYQFFYTLDVSDKLQLNTAFHYTRGRGFFEQFLPDDLLVNNGINEVIIGGDTVRNSDIIRRLWLDNHFYGLTWNFNYKPGQVNLQLGGGWNQYQGNHFGEVIWAEFAGDSEIRDRIYDNDSRKSDFHIFTKAQYRLGLRWLLLADLQYRTVNYEFEGLVRDVNLGSRPVQQEERLHFFNPKVGLTFSLPRNQELYASFSVGHKEPNRNDYVLSTPESRPRAEVLYDWEFGYRRQGVKASWSVNGYFMDYRDQLIVTGALNDVGEANRINVDRSFRAGIELQASVLVSKKLRWSGNATFSMNKVKGFSESLSFFGGAADSLALLTQGYTFSQEFGGAIQANRNLGNTDLAFSPQVVAASEISYQAAKNFEVSLLSKYVGDQFLDNSSSALRELDAYFVSTLRINYTIEPKWIRGIEWNLLINNLFDVEYESNGYTFGYFLGEERISENFYFPQAGIHFLLGLRVKL